MRILKSKFLLCIALLAMTITNGNSFSTLKSQAQYNSISTGGIIVMDDIIMAITLNDLHDHILNVVVLDAKNDLIFQKNGCGDNQCFFNLSTVASGSYTAVVYTEKGDSFSAIIQR